MGSMISKGHLAKVDGYIQKGIDEGAKMLLGGVSENKQKGFFAKPTLFDNVKENMTIAQEEIFGPVLGVLTVNNSDEALKIAKNSKYGLHASVFTQDINKAFHLAIKWYLNQTVQPPCNRWPMQHNQQEQFDGKECHQVKRKYHLHSSPSPPEHTIPNHERS